MSPRAFLYARVSTVDKEQSPEPQLREMNEFCTRRGWEPESFSEYVSAGKRRPVFEAMLAKIRMRQCDVLVCRHFDRVGRSTIQLCSLLEELQALGIQFVSLNQQIDTSTPHGRLMFQMLAAFAEFERAMIRERVLLGMAAAREEGKVIGRPPLNVDSAQVALLRQRGLSLRAIAKQVSISEASVRRVLGSTARPRQKGVKK